MPPKKIVDRIKERKGPVIALAFMAGLLLGWVVLAWWFQSSGQGDANPWDLRPEYQRKFISLVAEDYWRSNDVSQAKEALAGWDDEALNDLLAEMQGQASSSQERQQLAALAGALRLPGYEAPSSTGKASLLASLIKGREQPIIWGTFLSLPVPVVAASIIFSLRILNIGTEQKQRARARQAILTQGGPLEGQQPGMQQLGGLQIGQMSAEMASQMAQMQPQMDQSMAQMQQQMAQMDPQVAQMQQQVEMPSEQAEEQPAPLTPEQVLEQLREQMQSLLAPMQDWTDGLQECLSRLQKEVPEVQPLVGPMLSQLERMQDHLVQTAAKIPDMSPLEAQGEWGQIQLQMGQIVERLKYVQSKLPPGVSPLAFSELLGMQQQTAQLMTQVQQQLAKIQEQFGGKTEEENVVVPEKSELEEALADILLDAFEEEETMDPHLENLAKDLDDIDIQDLLGRTKQIASQLGRGISLAPGLIYDLRRTEA